jgi:hypothetical protein
MHDCSPGTPNDTHTFGAGHGSPHAGKVPHVVGGQTQPTKSGTLTNAQVTPG